MSDNGKDEIKPEVKPEEAKPVVMVIEMQPDGKMMVHFPLLNDKIATYGFLKMAEKTLDRHYAQIEQPKIVKPGGIMNFVRGGIK
ncbi:MAG: hypothetical protein ABIA66_00780 [Candidatus Omnitrophota bacterium]